MGLTTKYSNSYVNDKGTDVFVHHVFGTPEELEAYETAQGEFYRFDKETGRPLYYSIDHVAKTGKLGISQKSGNVYVDDSEMKIAKATVKKAGGDFGKALADAYAQKFLGISVAPPSVAVAPAVEAESTTEEGDL